MRRRMRQICAKIFCHVNVGFAKKLRFFLRIDACGGFTKNSSVLGLQKNADCFAQFSRMRRRMRENCAKIARKMHRCVYIMNLVLLFIRKAG